MTCKAVHYTLDCAKTQLADLTQQWQAHTKTCWTCIFTVAARHRYCETGWELVKAVRQAAGRVADLTPPPPPENGTLF